jgi:Domain of unknown function (DUF4276)
MARTHERRKRRDSRSHASRIVCVVEGHGEVAAVPRLCTKVLHHIQAWQWIVDAQPIRHPRSLLVDTASGCGAGLAKVVTLAFRRPADAVLVFCDADDDCAAKWGPRAAALVQQHGRGAAVMATREYESWLLFARLRTHAHQGRPIEEIRDAKGALARLVPGYKPTVHQTRLTSDVDVPLLCELSRSFRKLVTTMETIVGAST